MKLSSTRSLEEIKVVLKDPQSSGIDPVYWVFSEIGGQWNNMTILPPGKLGQEFTKTFGHYHTAQIDENYHFLSGEGVILLQKKNGKQISEVVLVRVKAGDTVTITPEWGHSISNTGTEPLVALDDWAIGHGPADYKEIKEYGGMAYFLTGEEVEPNPRYSNLPQPEWKDSAEL